MLSFFRTLFKNHVFKHSTNESGGGGIYHLFFCIVFQTPGSIYNGSGFSVGLFESNPNMSFDLACNETLRSIGFIFNKSI